MKYEVIYEKYERSDGEGIVLSTFSAKNLLEAVKCLCNNINLYIESDQIVQGVDEDNNEDDSLYTPKDFLEELDETNGDGCDCIHLFKNLTTGETYFRSIELEEQDWN